MSTLDRERGFTPLPQLQNSDYPENAKRLMRVAMELFAANGYAGTSVREIVQSAEVTNPMLYYYFDSKEGLYRRLVGLIFEIGGAAVVSALDEAENIEEAVEAVVRTQFREARRSPIALKFCYSILFGPSGNAPSFDVFEARMEMVERIRRVFDEAIEIGEFEPHPEFADPEFLADQLLGLVSNHLQFALKRAELEPDFKAHLESELTPEAAARLQLLFFRATGTETERV